MNRRPGYSKEVRERSVRLVLTGEHDHSSRWAAIKSVASKIERENRELKRTNEILRKAAAFFAQAELDRKPK